jgi:hypothetical protein
MPGQAPRPGHNLSDETGRRLARIGLAGLVLGLSGLVMTFATPVVSLRGYGVLLMLLGVAQGAEVLWSWPSGGVIVRALLALIYLACGAALTTTPAGLAASTHLVATLLFAAGAFRFAWSLAWPSVPRLWGAAAGLATLGLGLVILAGWPASAMWVLGLAITFDLSIYGMTALLLGRSLRG